MKPRPLHLSTSRALPILFTLLSSCAYARESAPAETTLQESTPTRGARDTLEASSDTNGVANRRGEDRDRELRESSERSFAPVEAGPDEWTRIPEGDPTQAEITFPAGAGWQGTLVIDNDVGIWTVGVMQVFRTYGCPEIVGLDDKGRCHVMWGYSGKWTPATTVSDGKWLGGLAQGDVDPRIEGPEVYVGSQSGHLYQVVAYPGRIVDNRRVARLEGREVHSLIAGEFDPRSEGAEILAFCLPGSVYRIKPGAPERDGFEVELLAEMDGRVRQAELLPQAPGQPAEIAVVMRTGHLQILSFGNNGANWAPVHELPMGMGRLAIKSDAPPERPVIYSTVDDGRVYRHERGANRQWRNELIYAGPQGMRGIASGKFDADSTVETVAVYGYGHRVELLSRREGKWSNEVIFVDIDKGHWLEAGELDGRNNTDELVCSGYSGRIVLLARPPGYGLKGVLSVEPLLTSEIHDDGED